MRCWSSFGTSRGGAARIHVISRQIGLNSLSAFRKAEFKNHSGLCFTERAPACSRSFPVDIPSWNKSMRLRPSSLRCRYVESASIVVTIASNPFRRCCGHGVDSRVSTSSRGRRLRGTVRLDSAHHGYRARDTTGRSVRQVLCSGNSGSYCNCVLGRFRGGSQRLRKFEPRKNGLEIKVARLYETGIPKIWLSLRTSLN